ncbi:MAG: hypothetical protein U5O39_09915 [Gammaproteobacteria bacterium]|nr:hypothetical protein [Gammaproteobacteria bacterium]
MPDTNTTSFPSGHIRVLAERACERAEEQETEAIGAVILTVTAFEAFINEVAAHIGPSRTPITIRPLKYNLELAEKQRVSSLAKLEIIHLATQQEPLNRGATFFFRICRLWLGSATSLSTAARSPSCGNWKILAPEYKRDSLVEFFIARGVIDRPEPGVPGNLESISDQCKGGEMGP